MNTISEHDRKLAEALKSLSLAPVLHDRGPPKRSLRRATLSLGISTIAATAVLAVALSQPEVVRRIFDARSGQIGGTGNDEGLASSQTASEPHDARHEERSSAGNPVRAADEVTGSGFVVAPRMTTVFSKYEGRITRIGVEAGDTIEAGQVLVTLDDAGARFALEQAKAAKAAADLVLAARTIDLAQARSSLDRAETLVARDAASRQQFEDACAAAERASNAVAQAKQELASAELAIRIAEEPVAELAVRAPFAGTVTRLDARAGNTVLARVDSVRESQSLLTIADTTILVIDADVAETNIAALRPGLRGEAVLDAFPDRPFTVEVLRLAPVASAEKGTITLRLSLTDPPAGIRPNMAARIRIHLDNPGGITQ